MKKIETATITRSELLEAVEAAIKRTERDPKVYKIEGRAARKVARTTKQIAIGVTARPGCLLAQAGRFDSEGTRTIRRLDSTYSMAGVLDWEIRSRCCGSAHARVIDIVD